MTMDVNITEPTEENISKLYDILRKTPFKKLVFENEHYYWEASLLQISYGHGDYTCTVLHDGKLERQSSLTTDSALSLYLGVCFRNKGPMKGKIYY